MALVADALVANMCDEAAAVLHEAKSALHRYSIDKFQHEIFKEILDAGGVSRRVERGEAVLAMHLPLSIMKALHTERPLVIGLSVVLVLLESGIYVLDHLMDNELTGPLTRRPRMVVLTAAVSFLSYLPQMALAEMPVPAQLRCSLQDQLNTGLAKMSHGQSLDLAFSFGVPPTTAMVEKGIAGKTGARRGLYARLAASVGCAALPQVRHLEEFAMALGMARQIDSDLTDLYRGSVSRDIAADVCTYPLASFFETATAAEAASMRGHIEMVQQGMQLMDGGGGAEEEAASIAEAMLAVRAHLRLTGALRRTVVRQECFSRVARMHLAAAALPESDDKRWALSSWIDAVSWSVASDQGNR